MSHEPHRIWYESHGYLEDALPGATTSAMWTSPANCCGQLAAVCVDSWQQSVWTVGSSRLPTAVDVACQLAPHHARDLPAPHTQQAYATPYKRFACTSHPASLRHAIQEICLHLHTIQEICLHLTPSKHKPVPSMHLLTSTTLQLHPQHAASSSC